jgi:hypothetical protein
MCIRYRGNVSTEPLPSNIRGILTEPLPSNNKGNFTEPLPSNNKGIFTEPLPSNNKGNFTEPLPSNDRGINRHTHRQQRDLIRLLSFFQNKENKPKINLKEPGWGSVDWIHLTQDRDQWLALVGTVIDLHVP